MMSGDSPSSLISGVYTRRAGQSVTITEQNGVNYVSGDVTLWTFEKQANGTYYISTMVDGKKQYLYINGVSVTLSDTGTEITVTEGTGTYAGRVRLTNSSKQAINLYGGSAAQGFGGYNDSGANEWQILCEKANGDLVYDLNVPSLDSKGTSWMDGKTPNLGQRSTVQNVTGDIDTLYPQPEEYFTATGTAGIANLYRFNIGDPDGITTEPAYTERTEGGRDGLNKYWYGEERFDGWEYTDDEGNVYLLPAGAEITKNAEDTGFTVTDSEGNEVFLPKGTMLKGKWTEVSNVVTFYVNYKGTILDTEGDVSGRRQDTFTKSVAVGHVFYGKLKVGEDSVFGTGANEQITGSFAPEFSDHFESGNPNTQIVIEYMRECTLTSTTGEGYQTEIPAKDEYRGVNSKTVEKNTLKLLQKTGRTVQVSTGNGSNPTIDNSLCDTDHYQIRWYVMKEQFNTWHVDGVLVAKTAEIAVTKTFSGLENTQVEALLGKENDADADKKNHFQIGVKLGPTQQDYITITNKEVPGQYEYAGSDGTANLPNSYHWTFHAITDETYTLSEDMYQLDGYDVSSIIVHYYKDERTGQEQIEYDYGTSTDVVKEKSGGVIGGRTTAVSFNNFYTPKNTGAMAIVKRDRNSSENDVFGKLQKAEFALYEDFACTKSSGYTATSNGNGTAYFSNLVEGNYYLKETKAPEGYIASNKVFKIEVTSETSGDTDGSKIVVRLYELTETGDKLGNDEGYKLYDGGILGSYTVWNEANTSTVTVTKTFSGLTNAQMDAIVEKSKLDTTTGNPSEDGYYIKFQGNISGEGDIDADKKNSVALCLGNAMRSQDNMSFTWVIYDLAVEDTTGNPITYTFTEYNYLSDDYADTVVNMRLNGEEKTIELDRDMNMALVSGIQFRTDSSDHIVLTNRYTNTFDLKLKKVDSKTGAVLEGAKFSIYGPYRESTNPTDRVTYTDEEGTHTYYYITDITSDENGIAKQEGLTLSKDDNTFLYVMKEIVAPDTYIKLDTPIVAKVTVDTDNYDSGVFSIEAENTKERDAVLTLYSKKMWEPDVPAGAKVTLQLYRVEHIERGVPLKAVEDAELVTEVTLDGTAEPPPGGTTGDGTAGDDTTVSEPTGYESEPWLATWENIPAADTSEDAGEPAPHYHYFVREITEKGYSATYECYEMYAGEKLEKLKPEDARQTLRVRDTDTGLYETFDAVLMADMAEDYMVEITNTEYYELPGTGGTGTKLFTLGGALLAAGSLLYGYSLRRKRERRGRR